MPYLNMNNNNLFMKRILYEMFISKKWGGTIFFLKKCVATGYFGIFLERKKVKNSL